MSGNSFELFFIITRIIPESGVTFRDRLYQAFFANANISYYMYSRNELMKLNFIMSPNPLDTSTSKRDPKNPANSKVICSQANSREIIFDLRMLRSVENFMTRQDKALHRRNLT